MKKILFYTDCPIFGGCEKPVFEVLSSKDFASVYDFTVVFRSTKEYLDGLKAFWPDYPGERFLGVGFPDVNTVNYRLMKDGANPPALKIFGKLITFAFILMKPFILIYEIAALSSVFSKNKADTIHINNGGYPGALGARAAVIAARRIGIKKIILSVHNTAFANRGPIERAIDFFVKRGVDVVITGSKASARALVDNRGFDKDKIVTIYHGVRPAISSSSFGRHVSMVARFEERKGHVYAIRAFKNVIRGNPKFSDVKLILIGDGPIFDDIRKLISAEGLDDNVNLTGHRNDYIDYVASSLFLLNPSTGSEDLPYIILEAMSAGIPVIGTDVAGIPEEIDDGITGLVVQPKDTAALEGAMLKLLSDGEKRNRMKSAAEERFRRLFTIEKMKEGYLALYGRD